MAKSGVLTVAAVLLAGGAALVCQKLLLKHVTGSSGSAWFEAGCTSDEGGGAVNCAAVLASPNSYIPPKRSQEPDGRPRLPVAFVGLVYYSALTLWFIGIGRPAGRRRWLHLAPVILLTLGLAGSVYFTVIMFTVLNEWCPWCLVTHGLNLLLAVVAVLMWPQRADEEIARTERQEPATDAPSRRPSHPSGRLVLVTLLAIVAVAYGELNMLGLKTWRRQAEVRTSDLSKCLSAVERIKGDTETLVRHWRSGAACSMQVREDDPARPESVPSSGTVEAVVFSDFHCPMCRRFASFVEDKVRPLFAGRLRVVFKHYPLDTSCNPMAGATVHPGACAAARMAEAARQLGGNDAFWQTHDFLFANADELKREAIGPDDVASLLGLDPAALRQAMASEETTRRLAADAEQAKSCGLRGTPGVFVAGRLVDILALMDVRFWEHIAQITTSGEPS